MANGNFNINVPQRNPLQPIRSPKPRDFTKEIIESESVSPLAQGVEQIGKLASQAISGALDERQKRKNTAEIIEIGIQMGLSDKDMDMVTTVAKTDPNKMVLIMRERAIQQATRTETQRATDQAAIATSGLKTAQAGAELPEVDENLRIKQETAQAQLDLLKTKLTETDKPKDPQQLRKEFTKITGEFQKVTRSFQRVKDASIEPSAAGDLALIFNYMKMLDPGSVVRESEFATAKNSASVPDRVRATYNGILRGEKLAPETRKDFVDRAGRLFRGQQQLNAVIEKQFVGFAEAAGIDPKQVIVKFNIKPLIQNKKAPKIGDDFNGQKIIKVKRLP